MPSQVELNELVSVGMMGLIDAARRYQPSLGVPFDAFARRRVHGAMLDSLRGLDWAPRSVRRMRREVDGAIAQPAARAAAASRPNVEIAAALSVSEPEYDQMLDQIRAVDLAALRQLESPDDQPLLDVAIESDEGPHARLERAELREHLAEAILRLPERERQILSLYYEHELTLAEIGDVIGVGESRVSQMRTQAIARLRSQPARVAAAVGGPVMSRILSQEEIDALLASTPAEAGRAANGRAPVIAYNFRRPDRVSKDQIRSLHFLHDRFARNATTSLSAFLRTTTELSIVSVEQFAYSEFLLSLPDPTAFYAVAMPPFDALAALELNPGVAFAMVDRMLGGSGESGAPQRALTEIEQNVVDAVVKLLLEHLTETWKTVDRHPLPDPRARNAAADAAGRVVERSRHSRHLRPQGRRSARPAEHLRAGEPDRGERHQLRPGLAAPSSAIARRSRSAWLTESLGRVPLHGDDRRRDDAQDARADQPRAGPGAQPRRAAPRSTSTSASATSSSSRAGWRRAPDAPRVLVQPQIARPHQPAAEGAQP